MVVAALEKPVPRRAAVLDKAEAKRLGELLEQYRVFVGRAAAGESLATWEYAVIELGIRTIQSGAREGEKTNEVKGIFPVPEDLDLDALGVARERFALWRHGETRAFRTRER